MYDREVHEYAQQIKRNVDKNVSLNHDKYAKHRDYPACVSICFSLKSDAYVKGYSHSPEGTVWHSVLKRVMGRLGTIGKPTINHIPLTTYTYRQT